MKKVTLIMTIVIGILAIASSVCFAQSAQKTFNLSATVPQATGIAITPYQVDTASGSATIVAGLNLSFDPLTYDTINEIWVPDHYFYINVEALGGVGTPTTTITYTEGTNPNAAGGGNGLGWKGNLDYTKVDYATGSVDPITGHPKELLKDVSGDVIGVGDLPNAYLRLFTGVNTGDSGTPAGGEVFSNADEPGTYDGSLLVSATII